MAESIRSTLLSTNPVGYAGCSAAELHFPVNRPALSREADHESAGERFLLHRDLDGAVQNSPDSRYAVALRHVDPDCIGFAGDRFGGAAEAAGSRFPGLL
jgi:hypothetical protein